MKRNTGFTIVELLIVIVVIAILASITIVAFNGIQDRARTSKIQSDIRQVHRLIEAYNVENGFYPITSGTVLVGSSTSSVTLTDSGCGVGTSTANWVPGLTTALPQSDHNTGKGIGSLGGCYMYQSDGRSYVLSAWNMLTAPQSSEMYRRVGFREMSNAPYYFCNHTNIGGNNPLPYSISRDYHKYSFTITNITFCNETPPAGA